MKHTHFMVSLLLVIVWMIVIFILSEMPSDESNGNSKKILNKILDETVETFAQNSSDTQNDTDSIKASSNKEDALESFNYVFRKFAHTGVYFVLSILVLNLFLQIKNSINIKFVILSIFCCSLYACTDEFHQLFVDGRTGQFLDVGIDTIGALVGAIIFYGVYRLFKNRKKVVQNVK